MNCVPLINWKLSNSVYLEFKDFKLVGEEDIISILKFKTSDFNITNNSNNNLVLKLRSNIRVVEEEYDLSIGENTVELTSPSLIGLFHGLSTLKLLLYSGNGLLKHGIIGDAPKFSSRGVFLDVSRGKMPTIEYLKHLVSFISDLKYNIVQIYCEDKLELKTDSSIGLLTGAYTETEIRELDNWCRQHFIELQPCIQTYSHLHGILSLPEYEELSENHNLFSMAAGNEKVYEFFEREFKQVLPWFSSKTLNINMDEAYDLGTDYTKKAVLKEGKGKVYLKHIMRVYDIAKKNGIEKIIVWGDIALKYQELLKMLPEDIIISDWNYNPLKEFPSLDVLGKSGIDFWAAGGVSTWNSLFPRIYNSYVNLSYYSSEALKKGAKGFLVTDWGDYGHFQPLGLSLYGYMVGAQQSYHGTFTEVSQLEANILPLIIKDQRIEQAFRLLMDSNLGPNMKTDFKTMSIYYFFDDLFDGLTMNGNERYPKLNKENFRTLKTNGEKASEYISQVLMENDRSYETFPDKSWNYLFGRLFLGELHFSAKATEFTGKKGLLSLKIKESFKAGDITPKEVLSYIVEIKQLYSEFLIIRSEFENVWISRANWKGIETIFMIFDKAGVQLGEAVKWLSNQYRKMKQGKELDKTMETYVAGKDYNILWTTDYKHMWERAYPWQ